jgi:hypothetical protein
MITTKDGRSFTGTPLQIVKSMKGLAFGAPSSVADYIQWIVENTQRYEGVGLNVTGETDEELATSLVDEMVRVGLATRS